MRIAFPHPTTEERRDLILRGPALRTLMLLSVPSVMLGLAQSLLPLVDGLFINNIAGTIVASAVTYSGPVVNMASALGQGLSIAAMAILGQMNGRGDFERSRRTASQIVVFGAALGCVSAPFLVGAAALASSGVNREIARDVFLYLSLNALVLPFSFMESIYNGIMNANGKPEAPFVRMVLMLVAKVAFNFVFIYFIRLGIVGCVLSSLCANALISAWMYWELFRKPGDDRLELRGFRFEGATLRELVRVGFPAMLNSLFLNLGFFLINNETQKYGPVVLAAQGIAGSITNVCFILPGVFSSAATMMVSMSVGSGDPAKARRACWIACAASAATAVAVIAAVVPLAPFLTRLFTRDEELRGIAIGALHIYTYSVVGFGICMTVQGAFVGLGRTKVPLVLGILRIWLLRYVFILATERELSFYSVFWGNLFSNYAAAALALVLIARTKWESALGRGAEPGR
jgi:putative MATE family efflux protein